MEVMEGEVLISFFKVTANYGPCYTLNTESIYMLIAEDVERGTIAMGKMG
jgi:hypothetical protein